MLDLLRRLFLRRRAPSETEKMALISLVAGTPLQLRGDGSRVDAILSIGSEFDVVQIFARHGLVEKDIQLRKIDKAAIDDFARMLKCPSDQISFHELTKNRA